MIKQEMIRTILSCRGYDGTKKFSWLIKQPKTDIKEIYDNSIDWNYEHR